MNSFKKHYMTLLELIISMSIFTIIMVVLAGMVYSVSLVTRKQKKQTDMYQEQRLLMSVITQDLQSIIVSDDLNSEISCVFAPLEDGDYEYSCFMITNSGLGVTPGTDTSYLAEVFYCRKILDEGTAITKDTPLYRCMVTTHLHQEEVQNDLWNFLGNPTGWGDRFGADGVTSALVATGVSKFTVRARLANGDYINGTSTTAPVVVSITVALADEGDTVDQSGDDHAIRVFSKQIFIDRGN